MPDLESDETQAEVTRTLAAEAVDGDGQISEPAADASVSPNAAEPAGATSHPEETRNGNDPQGEETPKGPVPYDRFAEVNRERNEATERARNYEMQLAQQQAQIEAAGRARAQALLEQIAADDPDLRRKLLGVEPEGAAQDPNAAKDPVQQKLAAIERQMKVQDERFQMQERQKAIDELESRAESQMGKHKIFERSEHVRGLAESIIAQRIVAERNTPIEKIVDQVAEGFRKVEEDVKASFKQAKVETAKKIPAGVGSGGAVPPGASQKRFDLSKPNDLNAAVRASLEGAQRG